MTQNMEGSVTFCEEFESVDDVIPNTAVKSMGTFQPHRRHTVSSTPENLKSSAPNLRHSEFFGKENESQNIQKTKSNPSSLEKPKISRGLRYLSVGNRTHGKKTAGSHKTAERKLNPKRGSVSFEIFRSDDENIPTQKNECEDDLKTSKNIREPSPEYDEPGTLFGAEGSINGIRSRVTGAEHDTEELIRMCPVLDPIFRKREAEEVNAPPDVAIESIITRMEKNEVPASKDQKKRSVYRNSKKPEEMYLKQFSVEKLLKVVPDPWTYFSDTGRECRTYAEHSLHYLKMKFRKHYNQTITDALHFHNYNLYLTHKYLTKKNRGIKTRLTNRPLSECNANKPTETNQQFLLEVAFIEQEELLLNYVKHQKIAKKYKRKEATRLGLLVKCGLCSEDFSKEDVLSCNAGHVFCKECVTRFIEIEIKRGYKLECLGACREKYTLKAIQEITKPEVFSEVVEACNLAEAEDVARCPHCPYVTVQPSEITVITCLNLKCLKVSCRLCKKANHEPFQCDEISQIPNVEAKENKMVSVGHHVSNGEGL